MVGIVYAQNVGGAFGFNFKEGRQLAAHVQQNRSDLFKGVPDPNRDDYDDKMRAIRSRGWSLNWKNEEKAAKNG